MGAGPVDTKRVLINNSNINHTAAFVDPALLYFLARSYFCQCQVDQAPDHRPRQIKVPGSSAMMNTARISAKRIGSGMLVGSTFEC